MHNMFFSLFLVFISLTLGYVFQVITKSARVKFPYSLKQLRQILQKIILSIAIPLTVVGSIWVAPLRHVRILTLPFLGALAIILGGTVAYTSAKFFRFDREQRAIYAVAGGFTNMGSLGGLLAFLLLGESGFALVAFYQLFEKFVYFMIGFPLAKNESAHRQDSGSAKTFIADAFRDPIISINIGALILGTVLNLTGIARPHFISSINSILVPLGSAGLLFSIGLAMRFGPMRSYWHAGLFMAVIKSLLVPSVIMGIALMLHLGDIEHGLVIKVVCILSAMPVGFMALVPPTLYDMDINLANTCWLFSTASLIVVVPLISFILPFLG